MNSRRSASASFTGIVRQLVRPTIAAIKLDKTRSRIAKSPFPRHESESTTFVVFLRKSRVGCLTLNGMDVEVSAVFLRYVSVKTREVTPRISNLLCAGTDNDSSFHIS